MLRACRIGPDCSSTVVRCRSRSGAAALSPLSRPAFAAEGMTPMGGTRPPSVELELARTVERIITLMERFVEFVEHDGNRLERLERKLGLTHWPQPPPKVTTAKPALAVVGRKRPNPTTPPKGAALPAPKELEPVIDLLESLRGKKAARAKASKRKGTSDG